MFTWWSPPYQGCFLSQHCMIFRYSDGAACRVTQTVILLLSHKTGRFFFFLKVHVTANMHQRYSVICHLTSSLCKPWFGISIVFMMRRCWKCVWVWQKKFTLEHQVRAEQKVGYISQVSSAISPFRFSQQRRTWIITKDVLCGKFQRYIRRRQRKWKEVTRSHQPALKTEPVLCYKGKKRGIWGSCMSEI